ARREDDDGGQRRQQSQPAHRVTSLQPRTPTLPWPNRLLAITHTIARPWGWGTTTSKPWLGPAAGNRLRTSPRNWLAGTCTSGRSVTSMTTSTGSFESGSIAHPLAQKPPSPHSLPKSVTTPSNEPNGLPGG